MWSQKTFSSKWDASLLYFAFQKCNSGTVALSHELFFFVPQIILQQNSLKLGDFGSCRSVYSKPPHTEYISTRWYRAPECLLTDGYYNFKMDMWSAGCVFFEIMRYLCRGRAWHSHMYFLNNTTVCGLVRQDTIYKITCRISLYLRNPLPPQSQKNKKKSQMLVTF